MKATFQRAALRATARIVFGSSAAGLVLGSSAWALGLAGCGGQALGDEPTDVVNPPGSSGSSSSGGVSSSSGGEGASTGEVDSACAGPTTVTLPPTLPGPTEAEFACCLTQVSTATKDWFSDEGRALATSEPVVNCCRVLMAAVDIDGSRYQQASVVHTPCCSFSVVERPELFSHSLCTPWGPPMPPALDWQAA